MLQDILDIRPGVTAIIGGGGKSTLMDRLARELTGTVVLCTTTRIYPPDFPVFDPESDELPGLLAMHRAICAARPAEYGKLQSPTLQAVQLAEAADYVLVEADGSKGLPLKAHAKHEPVVPASCRDVICVVGGDCFGRQVQDVCHRPQLFCSIVGLKLSEYVSPGSVAELLNREGHHNRVFVNKAELAGGNAKALAEALDCPVAAGSLREGWYVCLR